MDEQEFDKFAEEYTATHATNIRITGENPEYFADYKIRDIAALMAQLELGNSPKLLDFGAGVGSSVPYWRKYLPASELTCLDVSSRSLDVGRGRHGKSAVFVHFDGETIPFPDGHFDVPSPLVVSTISTTVNTSLYFVRSNVF